MQRPKWFSLSLVAAVGIGLTACAGVQPDTQRVETEPTSQPQQIEKSARGDNLASLSTELQAQKDALKVQQDRIALLEQRIDRQSQLDAQRASAGQQDVPIYSLPDQQLCGHRPLAGL